MAIDWKSKLTFLQDMANEGSSMSLIALCFDVSPERIRQVFKQYGLKPNPDPIRTYENRPRHYKKK